MIRAETYEKHIYCLEGNWNRNPRSLQSVRPILEILKTSSKVKYIYRKCQTKEDFFQYLNDFAKKRYANYSILYIAFHGRSNRIFMGKESVSLKDIADALEGKLSGKIVHFGSCSTLRTSEANIADFINRTGCICVSGYKRKIDYVSSTAFDLIYFDILQQYTNIGTANKSIKDQYVKLKAQLGFTLI